MFETLCGNCNHKNCCTDSAVPLLFQYDLKKIRENFPTRMNYIKIIKVKDKLVSALGKKKNSTQCVFWDDKIKGCDIYESRPLDCKLYPFDILEIDDSYHWIVYSCNKDSDWHWSEKYLDSFEKEIGFEDFMKNIDVFSDHTKMVLPDESKKTPYVILRKVNRSNS
ncbi:MAG: YkgJ family cysteine cluster protein [Nitrosopumilus sp.]|nr:YkgJ family cysteine cluster protein [Nitrosopumilus sp.]